MRIVVGALLLAAAPAAEMRYFAYERPLTEKTHLAGQSCAALDAAVFAHSLPELADMRVYRGEDETPYVLRKAEEELPATSNLTLLNLGMRDGRVVFDVAMPEGRYSDVELNLDQGAGDQRPGKDFLETVTVTGSDREGTAGTKLGDYTIFNLSGQQLGQSTVLHLPESDFRYLHFSVVGPLEAKSFIGASTQRRPVQQTRYVTVAIATEAVRKGADTVFSLPVTRGVPVDRLVVEPGARPAEFSRDVTVRAEARGTANGTGGVHAMEPFVEGERLLRVHRVVNGRRIDEEQLAFALRIGALPEGASVKVSIHNGSDAPIAVKSVQLEMVERDLCFDAAAGGSYVLYYGDVALERPAYDYARLFALDTAALRVDLGAEMKNPTHVARPDARPFTERNRWLLWVGLVVVVGILGMVAMRTAKNL